MRRTFTGKPEYGWRKRRQHGSKQHSSNNAANDPNYNYNYNYNTSTGNTYQNGTNAGSNYSGGNYYSNANGQPNYNGASNYNGAPNGQPNNGYNQPFSGVPYAGIARRSIPVAILLSIVTAASTEFTG